MRSNGLVWIVREARRRQLFGVLAIYVVGAWVILQIAATLFPAWLIPDEAIRYVWLGEVLLFPVALVFGWFYDFSSRGIRRTPSADSASLPLTRTDYGVLSIAALVTASVCFGVAIELYNARAVPQSDFAAREIPQNSIAVLPFVNMSDDQSNEYFSDGISEQLLNELARVPDLHVAARTSSFYYKDKKETMRTMGLELGVRTLLEGSVRKVGNDVRITAQLINAEDGYHLWSDTFDRKFDDIFALQDEIAIAIVSTLRLELLGEVKERFDRSITTSTAAFDLYLRAMDIRRRENTDSLDTSNELLLQAIDLDTEFAHAYDALAYGYLLKTYDGSMSIDDATTEAEFLLEKALILRPDLEEAHASFGLLKTRLKRYDEANEHYETALAINENYFAGQVNHGLSLVLQGRLKEASAAYLRAQALDPLNGNLNFNLGAMMMLIGEPDNGLRFMRRALEIKPDLYWPKSAITHWLGIYGELAESVWHGRNVMASDPENSANIAALARSYNYLGMVAAAQDLIAEASERFPDDLAIQNARISLILSTGDYESFFDFAEEEYRSLDVNVGDELNVQDRAPAYRYAMALLMKGEDQQASDYLYWIAGEADGIESKTYDEIYMLKMLALAYRRLDRTDEALVLLEQCKNLVEGANEQGWATPSLYARLAEVHAIGGDVDSAVSNLEIAFAKGWRDLSTLEYGIFWQELQDDPEINRIKVMILNELDIERERLRMTSTNS